MRKRPCEQCSAELPVRARAGTRFCGVRCRVRAHRATLPTALRVRDRWVTHSPAKVPLTTRGRPASSTDPRTWTSFEAVKDLPRRGFVLDGDGIVCLDLDHCLDGGVVAPWAAEILAALPSTYVEVSLSGRGLHVFGLGSVLQGRKIRDHRQLEVYGSGRFIAVTGNRWPGAGSTLADLSPVLASLLGPTADVS